MLLYKKLLLMTFGTTLVVDKKRYALIIATVRSNLNLNKPNI